MPRGRPESPEAQKKSKEAFVNAAEQCLKLKPYKEISLREIAAKAGQNSAMISYYFGSKEDLFAEVLENGIGSENKTFLTNLPHILEDDAVGALQKLVTQFISLHRNSPWLSRFIVDNIIAKPGKLRKIFVNRIIAINGKQILHLLTSLKQKGIMREDLDPELVRISFMSLMAFPFVAAPVLNDAFDFNAHEIDIEQWSEHTLAIFLRGISAQDVPVTQKEDC